MYNLHVGRCYVKCMLWVLQNYVSCHVAALLKLYKLSSICLLCILINFTCMYFLVKWILYITYVKATRVDDTEMKEPSGNNYVL